MMFNQDRITIPVIEHEMTHVFIDKCCIRSVNNFTLEQMEEFIAEFIPKYARKIIKVSKDLKKDIDKILLEE